MPVATSKRGQHVRFKVVSDGYRLVRFNPQDLACFNEDAYVRLTTRMSHLEDVIEGVREVQLVQARIDVLGLAVAD